MNMWHTYLLLCEDGTIYTGITNNLEKRFKVHKSGKGSRYVAQHRAKKIIYFENSTTKIAAMKREGAIKRLTHKQKLDLSLLSK